MQKFLVLLVFFSATISYGCKDSVEIAPWAKDKQSICLDGHSSIGKHVAIATAKIMSVAPYFVALYVGSRYQGDICAKTMMIAFAAACATIGLPLTLPISAAVGDAMAHITDIFTRTQ